MIFADKMFLMLQKLNKHISLNMFLAKMQEQRAVMLSLMYSDKHNLPFRCKKETDRQERAMNQWGDSTNAEKRDENTENVGSN